MRRLCATAIAAVVAVPLVTRQPPPLQTPPAFRATVDVVEVDAVVQDKAGGFVTDLKPEDFELRDEGKPQRIDVFYLVESNTRAVPPAGLEAVPGGASALPAASTAAPPRPPRVFVVVFDDEHLTPGGFKRVQAAAISLFDKHFQSGDIGGVVVHGQMVDKRLMTDRQGLLKAVQSAKPNAKSNSRLQEEREWPRMSEVEAVRIQINSDAAVLGEVTRRACADDPTACRFADAAVKGKAQQLTTAVRATSGQTLQSLLALLNGLSRMEGRKNILLLSEGFLAEESWPLVQQTVGQASRANARIYTLDARGLDRGWRSGQDVDPGANDSIGRLLAQFDMGADPINSLAVDTGGFVVRNTNYFDKAIEQVVQDAGNYYVLGYRPEAPADGKFRRVSVKVNRPGLTVRARRGYVASPRTPAVTSDTGSVTSPAATPAAGPGATLPPLAAPAPAEPAAAEPAPAASGAVVPRGPSTSIGGVRLRPDASKHVEALATAAAAPDLDANAGWEAYGRGDLEAARQSLAAAALRPSARPWVHYALGQSEYALRQYQDAIGEWEKVRAAAPEFEPVYFDLVDGYVQIQDRDKAIRVLRAAKERWPHDAEVFNALGVVQVSRGSLDDAVTSFRQAIDAAPKEPVGYFNLGKTLELRYSRSRRYVQQTHTWVANETDRTNAISNYQQYLALGGPLESSAREGLNRLEWARQP